MVSAKVGIGIVYGPFEFSAATAQQFVDWLQAKGHRYGNIMRQYKAGTAEFGALWMDMSDMMHDSFVRLQSEFVDEVMKNEQ